MVWPLRYSTIVEHGKCAKGSSSDLCGAYAVGLDAIVSSKGLYLQPGFYRAAQVSLIVSMVRTLNVELDPPELPVPRTVTLCPRCLAKASAGKPSAARFAMIAMVWPLTRTHFPSCSSTHPVNDATCPAGSAFCLGS